jgi:hypothetical protein
MIAPSVPLHAQEAGYCEPTVDVAHSDGSGITYVHLNGSIEIERASTVGEGFLVASDSAYLLVGGYYSLTIERNSGWTCPDNNLRAYIDFNGDGTFSETTETVAFLSHGGDGTETFNFVVPGNAHQGHTRLRICEKQVQACGQVPINSCGVGDSLGYRGEVEDYLVVIAGHVGMTQESLSGLRILAVEDGIRIQLPVGPGVGDRIEVFDATGRQLVNWSLLGAASSVEVPVPARSSGILIVRVTLAGHTRTERVLLG